MGDAPRPGRIRRQVQLLRGIFVPEPAAEDLHALSQLFEAPVPSPSRLGVGLYHSARQASQLGYRLALAANQPGMVCYVLTREGEEP